MFQFCSLYSGSSGNCSYVHTNSTRILIDVGQSAKKVEEALHSIDVDPNSIDGILITHEHSDHIKGVGLFSKKFNIPVYANIETWNAMEEQKNKIDDENVKLFSFKKFSIGDIEIVPFSIPHDAANPCGFNLYHRKKKMSIATDIGHIDKSVMDNLINSSFLLLEANYESNLLDYSHYPYLLKQRIKGPNGHLSNVDCGKTISYLAQHGLNSVMLGHLSKENNMPEFAYKTVAEQLIENNVANNINLSVARRYEVSPMIDIG